MKQEFKTVEIKQLDDEGRGTAVIATLGVVDKDGDITDPGAFGSQDIVILPAHDWSHIPLGKGVTREEDNKAFVDFKMNLDIPEGKAWHSALKFDLENGKPKQEWSYGFTVKDSSEETMDGAMIRRLKSLEVHEASPVLLGAGVGTGTVAIKTDKSMKFKDQIDVVIGELEKVTERAVDIKAKREKDGRDISDSRYEQIEQLISKAEEMIGELKGLKTQQAPEEEEIDQEEIANLHARFINTTRELMLDN